MGSKNQVEKNTPEGELAEPEQISSVVGTSTASGRDYLRLDTKDEDGHGTESTLEKYSRDDYCTLTIDYDDYYNSEYVNMSIDKDKAVKIINFLKKQFGI